MPLIGAPVPQPSHPSSTILQSLNKLLKELTDNQAKI